jgi:eukaryotic-like serine/threonine-protein kinase
MRRALLGLLVAAAAAPWVFAQASRPAILSRLIWFDRSGQRLGSIGPIADHGNLEISPDGSRVAVAVTDSARATRDIWMYNLKSGERTQFTSDPADENWVIWSPDGARVLLNSFARDRLSLLEAPSTGAAQHMPVLAGEEGKWPVSWSPDGRFVLYVTNNERTSNDIWVLLRDGSGSPYPYLHTTASENWAAFSPDGRWVVFSATESGQAEVFVAPFPAPTRRWRISADGGSQARWRRDGKEIFYITPNRVLMSVQLDTSPTAVVVKDYEPLFELQHPYGAYHAFDVTADGTRFLVNTLVVDAKRPGIIAASGASHQEASTSIPPVMPTTTLNKLAMTSVMRKPKTP